MRDLRRCNRGTSVIETAIIVPVLALLFGGGVDASLGFAQKYRDQQAADRAVQFAMDAGLSTATQTAVQAEATASSGLPTSDISVNFWLECNGVVQPSFSGTCATGLPARYLSVTVTDSYTPAFSRLLFSQSIPLQGFAEGRVQ
ncbi:MAG: pilus assembly protein [Sphingomonadales bacterium]|nr:pilus assembly protein [Sphingomonadales bacterium]